MLGGSGFIGRYVVKRLAARGEVIAVGCRNAEAAKHLKPLGDVGQIAPLNVGIGDATLLPAFLAGNDWLVNCVGILRESGAQTFELVHHTGPARLARFAREAGVDRFVHISAIGADPRSSSAYARSKAAGEQAVRDAFPTVTILRPSVVFGPEDQFFNRFAAMATISPVLPLIGGGETRFQPVYVGDVADAVVECLEDSATAGRTYELVVSISTLEHVGWDEVPEEPDKAATALEHIAQLGEKLLVTIPVGVHQRLESAFLTGPFDDIAFLVKTGRLARWAQRPIEERSRVRYGAPYAYGNGILVGMRGRPFASAQ